MNLMNTCVFFILYSWKTLDTWLAVELTNIAANGELTRYDKLFKKFNGHFASLLTQSTVQILKKFGAHSEKLVLNILSWYSNILAQNINWICVLPLKNKSNKEERCFRTAYTKQSIDWRVKEAQRLQVTLNFSPHHKKIIIFKYLLPFLRVLHWIAFLVLFTLGKKNEYFILIWQQRHRIKSERKRAVHGYTDGRLRLSYIVLSFL